jgi:UDP-N-acetylglucosamine:LPS N-acetylglucosamine transferase
MSKLLILSSDTGEGHNSVAAAIENAARSVGFEARIRKPLEESTRLNRTFANFYNVLLTRRPQWMSWYFSLIGRIRPNERDFCYTRGVRDFIGRFLQSEDPDFILSVHPMLNHFMQRFIKEEGLQIPCFTFVTDPFPPFWRGWSSPYIDQYFVPTDEALQALTATGVPAWKIERVPMPVRPKFLPATISEIEDLRDALKLREGSLILVNGGARGGGPILRIYKSVRRAAPDANVLVVCGRNSRLRWRIERMQHAKTRTFGFLEDIHRYVAAADLVVTKPGALSSYEALACGVPVLLTGLRCLMPQESGLFDAAHHYDFGFGARTFGELESVIRKGPAEWSRKRDSIPQFFTPRAVGDWIERILPVNVRA